MFSDAEIKWKATIIFIEALALVFQFIPSLKMPFIVPLLMQAFVVIILSLYYTYQMNLK